MQSFSQPEFDVKGDIEPESFSTYLNTYKIIDPSSEQSSSSRSCPTGWVHFSEFNRIENIIDFKKSAPASRSPSNPTNQNTSKFQKYVLVLVVTSH